MFPNPPLIRLGMCRFSYPCTYKCTQLVPSKGAVLPKLACISEDSLEFSHTSFLLGAVKLLGNDLSSLK